MAALLALLLLVTLAAPAGAATVTMSTQQVCMPRDDCFTVSAIVLQAAAGEVNDVTVTKQERDYRLADAGAPVTAGPGCRADGDHAAICTISQQLQSLRVELADGDDRAQLVLEATAIGGDGADAISGGRGVGGPGDDTISGPGNHEGGDGDDRIFGGGDGGPGDDVIDQSGHPGLSARLGPGADVYIGSPGDDLISDGGGADTSRDLIDGGGGRDSLNYGENPGPVVVDLGGATGQDHVVAVEDVSGTSAGDTLIGDAGPNVLSGSSGDDRLEGGGGDDVLVAGVGRDRIDGGAGADRVRGGGGADVLDLGPGDDRAETDDRFYRDRVDCGAGADRLTADRGDVRVRCERRRLRQAPGIVTRVVPAGGGRHRLHYDLGCSLWPSCRGTSRLHAIVAGRPRRVADVRFAGRAFAGRPRSSAFRLPAAARRQLREKGVLSIRVTSFADPGRAAGVLAARDRVRLRDRRRKAASDR